MTRENGGFKFSIQEVAVFGVSLGGIITGVTLWAVGTFETRSEASEFRAQVEKRFDNQKQKLDSIQSTVNEISSDVSYIKGRMESKK